MGETILTELLNSCRDFGNVVGVDCSSFIRGFIYNEVCIVV